MAVYQGSLVLACSHGGAFLALVDAVSFSREIIACN
jgi:hypothetical protein